MDLLLIVLSSVGMLPLALLASGPLRVVLGVLFVLFFPGYVLVAALFPKKTPFDGLERLALSSVMSLAVVPIIGLLLNYTPPGVSLESIAFSISGFIIAGCFVAFYRRLRLPQEERFEVNFGLLVSAPVSVWRSWGLQNRAALLALVLVLVGGMTTLVVVLQSPKAVEGFTEFYVLGPGGEMAGYPRVITLGQTNSVILGLVNREREPLVYRVELKENGNASREISRMKLERGERREWNVLIAPVRPGPRQEITFLLYRGESSEVRQQLRLIVDVRDRT